jgi:hypothetical protein
MKELKQKSNADIVKEEKFQANISVQKNKEPNETEKIRENIEEEKEKHVIEFEVKNKFACNSSKSNDEENLNENIVVQKNENDERKNVKEKIRKEREKIEREECIEGDNLVIVERENTILDSKKYNYFAQIEEDIKNRKLVKNDDLNVKKENANNENLLPSCIDIPSNYDSCILSSSLASSLNIINNPNTSISVHHILDYIISLSKELFTMKKKNEELEKELERKIRKKSNSEERMRVKKDKINYVHPAVKKGKNNNKNTRCEELKKKKKEKNNLIKELEKEKNLLRNLQIHLLNERKENKRLKKMNLKKQKENDLVVVKGYERELRKKDSNKKMKKLIGSILTNVVVSNNFNKK